MASNNQAHGVASELIMQLAHIAESLSSQAGSNEDSNLTETDIRKLQSISNDQKQLWDASEISPYLYDDLKATLTQLEQLSDIHTRYQLVDQTSYYIQSFTAAMEHSNIFEMMCGGIQSTEELNLWKSMALSFLNEDESEDHSETDITGNTLSLDAIKTWAETHQINMDLSHMREGYMDPYELDTDLVYALQETGYSAFGEQGSPPEQYMPSVIQGYLGEVDDADVSLISVTSDDDWDSARVETQFNQNRHSFVVENINQSDWVPEDLARKMNEFSTTHLNKVLYTIFGEDPFVVLYLDRGAAEEMDGMRQQLGFAD
jgi:hypothetical protein